MEGIEAVVVGERDVGAVVDEEREHVVALLRNGVVQRRVPLRVLIIKGKHADMSKRCTTRAIVNIIIVVITAAIVIEGGDVCARPSESLLINHGSPDAASSAGIRRVNHPTDTRPVIQSSPGY